MRKGNYKHPVFEDGPYVGIPLSEANSENFLADFFIKRARQKDSPSRTGDKIREKFNALLENKEDQTVYEQVMAQIKNKQSYRPEVNISGVDKPRLHDAIDRFLKNTYDRDPVYAREVDSVYLLSWLVKNMTNSDSEDPVSHVNRYADFVENQTFEKMRSPVRLGQIDDAAFYALNVEEYESGLETPDLFLFYAQNGEDTSLLPFLRYGIEQNGPKSTAYIYAIQRRSVESNPFNQQLKRIFAKANSGVKEHRDVQPSMLCVLSAFAGMLNAKGIENLKVPDFIVRRWGEFWQSETEQTDISIQTSATNKFLYTFQRLSNQFDGIDITAFPQDIDSFMHIKILPDAQSTNPMLQNFFEMGKTATIEREQSVGEDEVVSFTSYDEEIIKKLFASVPPTIQERFSTTEKPTETFTENTDFAVVDLPPQTK